MVRVYGFQRSGTHFLAQLLKDNFYPNINISGLIAGYGHYTNRKKDRRVLPYKALFRNPHNPPPTDTARALYIFRDGRAVARSLWMSDGYRGKRWKDGQFSKWLRTPLDWRFHNINAAPHNTLTFAEHWMEMLEMWKDQAFLVRYENLVADTRKWLGIIADHFGLDKPDKWVLPQKLVGTAPSGGGLHGWRELFSEDDIEYFHSIVPRDYWGLYNAG